VNSGSDSDTLSSKARSPRAPVAAISGSRPRRSRGQETAATEEGDVELTCGPARARIARRGAQARQWRVGDVDLLWPGDAAIWPEISPILFPIVGWTRDGARIDGRRYDLGLHGFARELAFAIEARAADFVRLVARDSAETRERYPFAFALALEYRLSAATLYMTIEVQNTGAAPLPYACGLHPGFAWPFAGGPRHGARVRFCAPEPAHVPVIAPGGLFSRQTRPIPLEAGTLLPLDDALFAQEALCFLDAASRSLRFEQADGSALSMTLQDFPHLALWTIPGAPFLCLEAWTGYGDPVGFAGDLPEKPSMRSLSPGAKARHGAVCRYHPVGADG
jgi:galactose mutarotase-like enzyme